jgi:ABC-type antimicrobial peptide transport system permease subunit
MLILGLLGALGLTIASVGVYGVMAYVVAERTNEIGIRMALGALPVMIMRSVLRRASTHVTVGTLIGVIASLSLADAVRTFLFGVEPRDPAVYVGAVAILMSVALVAACVPARRAARVDPLVALRYE